MFSYVLVDDALYLHGLHDVGDELWVSVGVSDLLVQQSSDAALRTHTQTQTHVTSSNAYKTTTSQLQTVTGRTLNLGLMV